MTYSDTAGLTTVKCVSLAICDNSLFLKSTTEAGTAFPQRLKWCAPGDSTDWTTASDGGDVDFHNTTDDVMFAKDIGPNKEYYAWYC